MKNLLLLLVIALSQISFAQLPSNGLVGWYPFNGNSQDESGNGNDLTNNGPTLGSDRFGNLNAAYISTANTGFSRSLAISGGVNFTYSAWVFRTSNADGGPLGEINPTSTSGGGMSIVSDVPTFICQGVQGNVTNASTSIPTGQWVHLAVTKQGSVFKYYIDGVLDSQGSSGYLPHDGVTQLIVGALDGYIDDVGIYNRAMAQGGIDSLFLDGVRSECLIAHYDFNGNANDESGWGNHGTVNGATLTSDRFGNANSAYSFDGVDDYIEVINSASLDVSVGGAVTTSFWINIQDLPPTSKEYQLMMHQTGTGVNASGYMNTIFEDGAYSIREKNGSGFPWGGSIIDSIPQNEFLHLVSVVKDDSSWNYLNGELKDFNVSTGASIGSTSDNLIIGWNNLLSNLSSIAFKGIIDDISIYGCALDSSQILNLWKQECVPFQVSTTQKICAGDSLFLEGAYQTSSGSYVDTLQAMNGCDSIVTTNLTVNTPIMVTATKNPDTGTGNGGINVSVTGGAAPYNYVWSNGAVTQDIQNVSAGTYDVDVTDTLGCMVNYEDDVLSACNILVTPNVTPASCGQNNGSVTLSVTGGTAPYTIQWTNGSIGVTADSLYPGMYFANISDANGCTAYGSVAVNSASGPQATANVIMPTCFNGTNGGINLTVTGGTSPYSYSWSNGKVTEDINNLQAGNYQVEIEDAAGCGFNLDVLVNQPAPLQVFVASNNAGCGLSNGGLAATAQGGTGPYSFVWSNGPTTAVNNAIPAGMYTVAVTDANGCVKTKTKSVNEAGGPVIMMDSTNSPSCGGLGAAYISAYGTNPLTYSWSNGSTAQDLTGVNTGNYVVTVTGAGGCVSNMSVDIESVVPTMVDLCLIGVDSTTQTNLIVWEKPVTQGIDHFNLYKEGTVANQYFLETSIAYASLSQYTDVNANPAQRAWRYQITTVDTCGMESAPSTIHKTIHLSVNQGQGNNYNLSWNHYEGITFGTYYINRHKPSTGWVTIDSLPSNLNTYTDFSQPQGNVNYSVEIRLANNCSSSKANHNTTRSNQAGLSVFGSGVAQVLNNEDFHIYPNPVSDVMNVTSLNGTLFYTELYDLSGARVWSESNSSTSKQLNMSELPNGVYMLKIISGKQSVMNKVVVQK